MHLVGIRALEGPNIHLRRPCIEMLVDLGRLEGFSTADLGDFASRLLRLFPGLREHHCSAGRPGGFVKRLQEGTYLGHVLEHVCLEIQVICGHDVRYGKTRSWEAPGLYKVVYEYEVKEVGVRAGELAIRYVRAVAGMDELPELDALDALKALAQRSCLGPTTAAIAAAARRRGIPVRRLNDGSLLQLGYGSRQRRVEASITHRTGCIGVDIAADKLLSKELLSGYGIPVPPGGIAYTEEEAIALSLGLGYPVAVKPCDGNQGKGVSLNLGSEQEVRQAFKLASRYSDRVIVEKHIRGRHYRVLVVVDRAVAASERIPAHVVGDGIHTVKELIDIENSNPWRGEGHEKPLTKIRVDPVVIMVLAKKGLSLEHTPGPGEVVFLRENANLSTGGVAVDATDSMHPSNAELCCRAARVVGLDVAGVDLVTEDLGSPIASGGALIEVNACPGLRMHHFPAKGKPRDVAGAILEALFPPGEDGRIPIVAVTGTNGKTTTARLIAHIMGKMWRVVGLATTDGISVAGKKVYEGDAAGPRSARAVLSDPAVDAAVLETARGGILRAGLGFDACHVAVVTNISEDHLGQDGVRTLEELSSVKSVVVEAVAPGGCAVLNADDPLVLAMARRARCEIVLTGMDPRNKALRRHIARGGRACYIKEGEVWLSRGSGAGSRLMSVGEIGIAHGGLASHNVQNTLAAAGAAIALNVPDRTLKACLTSFRSDHRWNPGRLNLVKSGDILILVDYGHNVAGYRAVLEFAGKLRPVRITAVIGVPGDRTDESIAAVGWEAARGCDRIIIEEDRDLRGRKPGEVARLLLAGVSSAGFRAEAVQVVLDECEAACKAVEEAVPGEMVVVFYENYKRVMRAVTSAAARRRARAVPASRISGTPC